MNYHEDADGEPPLKKVCITTNSPAAPAGKLGYGPVSTSTPPLPNARNTTEYPQPAEMPLYDVDSPFPYPNSVADPYLAHQVLSPGNTAAIMYIASTRPPAIASRLMRKQL